MGSIFGQLVHMTYEQLLHLDFPKVNILAITHEYSELGYSIYPKKGESFAVLIEESQFTFILDEKKYSENVSKSIFRGCVTNLFDHLMYDENIVDKIKKREPICFRTGPAWTGFAKMKSLNIKVALFTALQSSFFMKWLVKEHRCASIHGTFFKMEDTTLVFYLKNGITKENSVIRFSVEADGYHVLFLSPRKTFNKVVSNQIPLHHIIWILCDRCYTSVNLDETFNDKFGTLINMHLRLNCYPGKIHSSEKVVILYYDSDRHKLPWIASLEDNLSHLRGLSFIPLVHAAGVECILS